MMKMGRYGYYLRLAAIITLCFVACKKEDNLTLRNEQFPLYANGASGITGTVFVAENQDSSFNVTVKLNKSVKDSLHIMNVHNSKQNSTTNIAFKLVDIPGTGGPVIGETKNIMQAVESTGSFQTVSYDGILKKKFVLHVVMSRHQKDSILCSGEIGH
jgi:hypothetical protein